MKTIVVPILIAATAAAISGCTFKSTTVKQAEAPPPKVVYVQPAPAPTVYQPTVYSTPTGPTVNVTYAGAGGFDLAAQKAAAYCGERYGRSGARLIRDDRAAGRATFECS